MDDGQCDDEFISCGKRIGGIHDGGFSVADGADLWRHVTIPVVLVTKSTGTKLLKLMKYEIVDMPEWGTQYYPMGDLEDEL